MDLNTILVSELVLNLQGHAGDSPLEDYEEHSTLVRQTRNQAKAGNTEAVKQLIANYEESKLPLHLRREQGLPMPWYGKAKGNDGVSFCTPQEAREFYGKVAWAWRRWIPKGHVTMIAGRQAVGKSYFAAALIACFTETVSKWPDGTSIALRPRRVLLVETEEMKGVYAERLQMMGVSDQDWLIGPGDDPDAIPDITKEHGAIRNLAGIVDAGAIIVDSISGGHDKKENDAYMRRVLQPMTAVAANLKIPVIIIHHLRKKGKHESSKVTLDRVRGSSTITQFCRSVIGLYRLDGAHNLAPVRVDSVKNNFCKPPEPLGFVIRDDGRGLRYVEAPEEEDNSALGDAKSFLYDVLSDGKVHSTQLFQDADRAGIAKRTLTRAKREMSDVHVDKENGTGKWYWYLVAKDR